MSVDDLVERCYAAGYIKEGGEDTVARSTSGSLTMAVQPTNTAMETNAGNSVGATAQQTMLPPVSPATLVFENHLRAALGGASEGATALADATINLSELCNGFPNTPAFDPTSQLEVSFNPSQGEDAWDAQDVMASIDTFDFSDLVNMD